MASIVMKVLIFEFFPTVQIIDGNTLVSYFFVHKLKLKKFQKEGNSTTQFGYAYVSKHLPVPSKVRRCKTCRETSEQAT